MEHSTTLTEKRQLVEIVLRKDAQIQNHERAQSEIMQYLNSLRFVPAKTKSMVFKAVSEIITNANEQNKGIEVRTSKS